MTIHSAHMHLSFEQVEMLLKLDIPDPAFVARLKDHHARYMEDEWVTLRVRFRWRTNEGATTMLKWCNEHLGDRNIIERRWYVARDYKTQHYRHIILAFRYPADQLMFKIYWHDYVWAVPEKKVAP